MDGKDKILIVDDEPANIFLLELILEDKYELIKADNGKDTVRIAGEELPDLILLDIMMPVMDGLEVCKILSDNNKTRDIPIILVSAKIQDEDVEKGLDLGAVDYIKKPVSETELKARVRTALRIKHREDELKRLNKLKNDFLHIVSHDLLSPFTSILNSSSLLLNRDFSNPLNDIQKELIDIINKAAQKQLQYVKDILTLALQESDSFTLNIEECLLKGLIDEIINLHKFTADGKNISLINNVPENFLLSFDVNKISQVITNLISNSIKFTPRGGTIEVSAKEEEGKFILLIKDSGVGMSEMKIKELLGDGKVYSTSGTEEEMGTGLGVRICRKILDAHKATFQIESEENRGSTFTIVFKKSEL